MNYAVITPCQCGNL